MNCPNCGAGAREDNQGRWFCNMNCGWNSGYVWRSNDLWKLRRISGPVTQWRLVLHKSVRLVQWCLSGPYGGTVAA